MDTKAVAIPAWIEDERSLLDYLVHPHAGHAYAEDLIDAVALMTSWLLVGLSVVAVVAVVVDGLLS